MLSDINKCTLLLLPLFPVNSTQQLHVPSQISISDLNPLQLFACNY